MTMFTKRCRRQIRKWRAEFASSFKIFLMLILLSSFTTIVLGQTGTAPVSPPIGGFRIDGSLQRISPAGDWFAGDATHSAAGSYLFNPNGTSPYQSLVGQTLFWKTDPYTANGTTFGGTEDRFTTGSQLNQDPNDWQWDTHAPQSKDDINNAFFFIVQDTISHANDPDPSKQGQHWWAIMGGDRQVTNGTSYLDFEFLQAPISKLANGHFLSAGPDSGRTVGDIDVTLSYTGGGGTATANVFQWNPKGDGSFIYTSLSPAAGTVFVQHNTTNGTPFPGLSLAFGLNNYPDSLQFVEGAIDITALLGGGISTPCRGLPFTSIFIKTKSSASTTAELKDFIAPFAIDICTDKVPPTITTTGTPATGQLGCNPTTAAINAALGSATATDNCSTPTVTSSDGSVSSSGCSRSKTRTFTATDDCGNTATASRTATWTEDTTAPTITTTGNNTPLGCNPSTAAIDGALGSATATDACGTPTVTHTDGAVSSDGCSRSQTRTWTATDACGNTATASRSATWTSDVTPPTITTTGTTTTLGCNPSTDAINAALGSATATDNCGTPTVTHTDGTIGTDGCTRTQTRTWTATDGCGNTATAARTVTWTSDLTAPTLTATGTPADGHLGCNPTSAAIDAALGSASATDACGTPTVTSTDGAVSSDGCSRSQTRTWTATDGCGNTSTASRTATWTEDVTAPTLTATGTTTTLGCNPSTAAIAGALGSAGATDACGTPTVTQTDGAVGSDGCTRTQTRTWTATDGCGNTSTAARTVTWTSDLTPPTLTATGTGLNLCNPTTAQIEAALGSADATDACSTPTVTHTDGAITGDCAKSQTRTWTAIDACGNTATTSRTVNWSTDAVPPTITATGTPANGVLGCNPTTADIEAALGSATASDNCGTPTLSSSDGAVTSDGCSRSQTRTWTANDACGNTATASRTATWTEDVIAPVITATGTTTTLGCNPSTAAIDGALGSASATDNCGTPTLTHSDGAVSSDGCSRSQTRTWTATDACGNTATASRTATWTEDHTPPTLTCPADATVACGTTVVFGTPTATDNCDATPTINDLGDGTPVTNSDGSVTYSHSWSASDDCGNTSASCTQHITVSTCGAGCTIGFWKNHTDIWDGVSPDLPGLPFITSTNFRTYFGITNDCNVPGSAVTMIQVLNLNGGGCRALARQAVAAALNESILDNYDYPGGITQLKADVAAAFNGGCNCSALNTTLSNLNNREGTSCSALLTQTTIAMARPSSEQNSLVKDLSVTAYPNPYTDKVNFVISSAVSGQASLEIYNMLGQKMQTVYKGHVFAGKRETVEYKVPMTSRTNLIYILRLGDRVVTGKLLSLE